MRRSLKLFFLCQKQKIISSERRDGWTPLVILEDQEVKARKQSPGLVRIRDPYLLYIPLTVLVLVPHRSRHLPLSLLSPLLLQYQRQLLGDLQRQSKVLQNRASQNWGLAHIPQWDSSRTSWNIYMSTWAYLGGGPLPHVRVHPEQGWRKWGQNLNSGSSVDELRKWVQKCRGQKSR